MARVGLISDTHGSLDPRVSHVFDGVDAIVHAGDVGSARVLSELEAIAPVRAVIGNMDPSEIPGWNLDGLARLTVGGARILVVHKRQDVPAHALAETDVLVFGHTHMPLVREIEGVLWVNPGSAQQPRRSPVGRSVAILEIDAQGRSSARVVPLGQVDG